MGDESSSTQGRDATVGKDALTIAPHKRDPFLFLYLSRLKCSVSKLGVDAGDKHIGASAPQTYLQKELRATCCGHHKSVGSDDKEGGKDYAQEVSHAVLVFVGAGWVVVVSRRGLGGRGNDQGVVMTTVLLLMQMMWSVDAGLGGTALR